MQFPAGIQKAYANWQVSGTLLDGKSTTILQGTNPNELPVNFYFDAESGLLVRIVRWNRTAVGIVPTQIDFADYRDVNGVKMPHHLVLTWTDGQNTYDVQADPAERGDRRGEVQPARAVRAEEVGRVRARDRSARGPGYGLDAGSRISKTAPSSLRAVIVPPWRSTIAFTMDRPRPLPPADFRDASPL